MKRKTKMGTGQKVVVWAVGLAMAACIGIVIYDPPLRRCEALGGTRVISGRCMIVTESRMLVPWHPSNDDR